MYVQEEQQLALWLRGLMELCIYPPVSFKAPGASGMERSPNSTETQSPQLRILVHQDVL